jgi:hypothetical protein
MAVEQDDLVTPPQAGSVRRSTRWSASLLVITLLVIVAIALRMGRPASDQIAAGSPSPAATSVPPTTVGGPVGENATPPPSIGAEPTLDPQSVAQCEVDDLALDAGGWAGATGSMAGGATLINVSIEPCRVAGRPGVKLLAKGGKVIATGSAAAPGDVVVLLPGNVANVTTVWRNWCGDPPSWPVSVRLSLFETAGALQAEVVAWSQPGVIGAPIPNAVPRCDMTSAPSTIDADALGAPEPREPGTEPQACTTGVLAAYLGPWGAAAGTSYANLVVLNRAGTACSLMTSPPLELRDAEGTLLATAERWVDAESTFELPAGWAALTTIGFADWCLAPPKLPFRFVLHIGTGQLAVGPTSAGSEIGTPTCNSAPATPPPNLGYDGPFLVPAQ